jgi:predicted SprT family Zn-dependent metalloprotease
MDIFGEKLLQIKKAVFLNAVENAALALGVKPPKVKFWEGICPTDNGYSIAHIHLDTKTICIARRYLVALNFDELKEAATHEVAHLIEAKHNVRFATKKENAQLLSWKPPIAYSTTKLSNATKSKRKKKLKKKK